MLRRHSSPHDAPAAALHDELVALREENARLREGQYRPLAPTVVPETLAEVLKAGSGDGEDAGVAAAWIEVEVIRTGLIQTLNDLQTLAAQIHAQLSERVPAPELERRLRPDRRSRAGATSETVPA